VTREVASAFERPPNSEVVLNVEVMTGDRSVFKDEHFSTLRTPMSRSTSGPLNTPKPGILQTGPIAAAPAPARVMRVTAQ